MNVLLFWNGQACPLWQYTYEWTAWCSREPPRHRVRLTWENDVTNFSRAMKCCFLLSVHLCYHVAGWLKWFLNKWWWMFWKGCSWGRGGELGLTTLLLVSMKSPVVIFCNFSAFLKLNSMRPIVTPIYRWSIRIWVNLKALGPVLKLTSKQKSAGSKVRPELAVGIILFTFIFNEGFKGTD